MNAPLPTLEEHLLSLDSHTLATKSSASYRSTEYKYQDFCVSHNLVPWPPSLRSLRLFIAACHLQGLASSTIKSRISSIKHTTVVDKQLNWIPKDDRFRLKAILKATARAPSKPIRQAAPMTLALLKPLIKLLDLSLDHHVVHATSWLLAHDALLRSVELLNLRVEDVDILSSAIVLRIHRSKANQFSGKPEVITLHDDGPFSAFRFIKAYNQRFSLTSCDDKSIYFFPRLEQGFIVPSFGHVPMPKGPWVAFLRSHLTACGVSDPSIFKGHSFRPGGATDLWDLGHSESEVMLAGRWRSNAFIKYIRDRPLLVIATVKQFLNSKK